MPSNHRQLEGGIPEDFRRLLKSRTGAVHWGLLLVSLALGSSQRRRFAQGEEEEEEEEEVMVEEEEEEIEVDEEEF